LFIVAIGQGVWEITAKCEMGIVTERLSASLALHLIQNVCECIASPQKAGVEEPEHGTARPIRPRVCQIMGKKVIGKFAAF
jgi:hypothetical protein